MTTNAIGRVTLAALLATLLGVPVAGTASAQDNQRSSPSSKSGSTQGGQSGATNAAGQKAQTAQIGAGTDNETTPGFSGPKDLKPKSPGEVSVPPLPSAQLCDAYKNAPFYQDCLGKVLRTATSPMSPGTSQGGAAQGGAAPGGAQQGGQKP